MAPPHIQFKIQKIMLQIRKNKQKILKFPIIC